jgi:hypothetical protein
MKNGNSLLADLAQLDRATVSGTAPVAVSALRKGGSRAGAVQVAAFFPEGVRAQLKMMAAEQRRDVQDLLAEGLNLIFAKYGKPEIAPIRRAGSGNGS